MAGQKGVKETIDLLRGAGALNRAVFHAAKDGFDFTDIPAIATRPEVIAGMVAAGNGVQNVPGELKELDGEDVGQLVAVGVEELRSGLEAAGVKIAENEIGALLDMAPEFIPLMQANIAFVVKLMARLDAIKKAKAAAAPQS